MNNTLELRDCKAMVFAAGLGTRLKPFTDHHPKALALVNEKTLLDRNIAYLNSFGIRVMVVNVYHFADQILQSLQKYKDTDITIHVSHEKDGPYETGGGLAFASCFFSQSPDPFVVINVDILTDLDLNGMFQFHQKIAPLATLAVTKRESSRQFLFNEEMQLVGWRNNKTGETRWVAAEVQDAEPFSFSGVHMIDPELFRHMPASGNFSITDVYLKLAASHQIIGYNHSGDKVIDVGKPESIQKAEAYFR